MADTLAVVAEAKVCTTCGTQGLPKTRVKGSFAIELLLWICCLLPGMIYTAWRLTTKEKVCRVCQANTLVPIDSPVGRRILSDRQSAVAGDGDADRAADRRGAGE